jgi:hypothetical protein
LSKMQIVCSSHGWAISVATAAAIASLSTLF